MISTGQAVPLASAVCRGRGGHLYFAGTFVPVAFLWRYLAEGHDLTAFLAAFPCVKREQAVSVLTGAGEALAERFLAGEHSFR